MDRALLEAGRMLGRLVRTRSALGFACHEVFYPAGSHLEEHAHESAFFGLSLVGTYRDISAGTAMDAQPRSVVFHAAGEQHSISVADSDLRCFVLELDSAEIRRRYGFELSGRVQHHAGGSVAALLTSAYRELRHPDSCSSLAIEGLLLQVLAETAREETESRRPHPRWLERVREILHERFRSPLTLDEIAADIGVPPAKISAAFRRRHGHGIAEEQRKLRIEFACRRMLDRGASLAEIALEAGFADQPHFSRTLRKVTGMTPGRYRALMLKSR